ncbi:MAG: PEP-CTERM sorting domain-containing protein [Verrucomicrobiota bacterium]|nr:PEP-CTERM sorting domain-containing protein [Verrucomicrobiota bacterium]
MQKILLLCIVSSLTTYGQGIVRLSNFDPSLGIDAKVALPDGTGAGAGITAQLLLVRAGGALTPLTPTTTFQTASEDVKFYVNPVDVVVPGVPPGQSATFRFIFYSTSAGSYDAAANDPLAFYGQWNDVTVPFLGGDPGGGGAILPAAPLLGLGFQSLTLVPEPGTIALGILGGLALLARRRK